MSSDESIWRMRVLSTTMPEYVGELVRCKDCALYDGEDGICYRDPNHSGYYRPAHDDGFCAWAEKREDEHMDLRELDAIADRIDAEMMELPRDRDGSPIHVGDTVYLDDGREAKVTRIGIRMDEDSIYTIVYGDDFSLTPGYVTHARPDSFERIADELEEWSEDNRVNGSGEVFDRARGFSDRIRKLAEKEGE